MGTRIGAGDGEFDGIDVPFKDELRPLTEGAEKLKFAGFGLVCLERGLFVGELAFTPRYGASDMREPFYAS
jgi:hypothetical protein